MVYVLLNFLLTFELLKVLIVFFWWLTAERLEIKVASRLANNARRLAKRCYCGRFASYIPPAEFTADNVQGDIFQLVAFSCCRDLALYLVTQQQN